MRIIAAAAAPILAIQLGLPGQGEAPTADDVQTWFEAGQYQEVVDAAPHVPAPEAQYLAAMSHEKLDQTDEARGIYQQLVERGEDDPWALIGRSASALVTDGGRSDGRGGRDRLRGCTASGRGAHSFRKADSSRCQTRLRRSRTSRWASYRRVAKTTLLPRPRSSRSRRTLPRSPTGTTMAGRRTRASIDPTRWRLTSSVFYSWLRKRQKRRACSRCCEACGVGSAQLEHLPDREEVLNRPGFPRGSIVWELPHGTTPRHLGPRNGVAAATCGRVARASGD